MSNDSNVIGIPDLAEWKALKILVERGYDKDLCSKYIGEDTFSDDDWDAAIIVEKVQARILAEMYIDSIVAGCYYQAECTYHATNILPVKSTCWGNWGKDQDIWWWGSGYFLH